MAPLRLVVWSDYLCPWCYVASERLHRLAAEVGPSLEIEWRSYLLRPQPDPQRTHEQFVRYTRSWLRPAGEPDAPEFRVWKSPAGPPSHSMPPHLVAKAAATFGRAAFERMHTRLLRAYFAENQDITAADTLLALWTEVGLPREGFARAGDAALVTAVVAEHNDAIARGVHGVPATLLEGSDVPVSGALPLDTYRGWVRRALAASA